MLAARFPPLNSTVEACVVNATTNVEYDAGTRVEILRRALMSTTDQDVRKKRAMLGFMSCFRHMPLDELVAWPSGRRWKWTTETRVILVGNGPVRKRWGKVIDAHDVVVRFNYMEHADSTTHGTRVDLQLVNSHAFPEGKISTSIVIPLECDDPAYNEVMYSAQRVPTAILRPEITNIACQIWNPSRGFLGLCIFLAVMHTPHVTIVGFGQGVGHHTRGVVDLSYQFNYHDIRSEWQVIDELARSGHVRALERILPVPKPSMLRRCAERLWSFFTSLFSVRRSSSMTFSLYKHDPSPHISVEGR